MRLSSPKKEITQSIELPLLPLKDIVVFPHMIIPVFINEEICREAVEASLKQDRKIFLSTFKVQDKEGEGLECELSPPFDVYNVGTICSVMRTRELPDGRFKVLVQGIQKAKIVSLKLNDKYPLVSLSKVVETSELNSASSEAIIRSVRENLETIASLGKVLSPDILMILEDVNDPGKLADLVASNLGLNIEDSQMILAIENPLKRLSQVHSYLTREIEVFQMQVKIQNQAKEEMGKLQKDYYLREQIKALKSELGDGETKDEAEELWQRYSSLSLPKDANEEVHKQLKRLDRMQQESNEASLIRAHVETILDLPWGVTTSANNDLRKVAQELESEHFGLKEIKDRVIEYLAVKKLNPGAKSPILCFCGPPGVGKTSLGESIARSLGLEFERISLGGVRDEADIRGHRKTYIGAYSGRIISAIRKAKTSNPVIMLDEIDKLSSDFRGDPASALLETLDPEQNHDFVDHYIGVPFDLSNAIFIANANEIRTIPPALRDRLEVIDISGYSDVEKTRIAIDFLIPKQLKETGLAKYFINFTKPGIEFLIRGYTRESGLRSNEKKIASICRKIAREVAEGNVSKDKEIKITPTRIKKYLGAPIFNDDQLRYTSTIGVSLGMAYTQAGGELLPIETKLIPSSNKGLVLTGQIGEVMRESAQTALSFIKANIDIFSIDPEVFNGRDVHIHFPQGAVPKEGPSAGTAIASSILSSLLQIKILENTSMTGEITLHGKVLAIGGLKEKLLAAKREDIKNVILPAQNRGVVESIDINIKKGLKIIFIDNYLEAFPILFDCDNSKETKKKPRSKKTPNNATGLAS